MGLSELGGEEREGEYTGAKGPSKNNFKFSPVLTAAGTEIFSSGTPASRAQVANVRRSEWMP